MNNYTLFQEADKIGIKLEIVKGTHIWEAFPTKRHQKTVDRIRNSIKKIQTSDDNCKCIHYSDVYISFPDGSYKRPDISIFCQEPVEEDESITMIPEAVIEIISKGYEKKDLEIGPTFYLSQGIKDVVVFNPHTLSILHVKQESAKHHVSKVKINLECGCEVEL